MVGDVLIRKEYDRCRSIYLSPFRSPLFLEADKTAILLLTFTVSPSSDFNIPALNEAAEISTIYMMAVSADCSDYNTPSHELRYKFQRFPFNLPNELLQLIAGHLGPGSIARLIQTSRRLHDALSLSLCRIALTYKVRWRTPVWEWAMAGSHVGLVEKLLQLDPGIISTERFREELERAACDGNLEIVRYIINLHPERLRLPLESHESLHFAALGGHLPVVKFLIHEAGVDLSEMYATGGIGSFFCTFCRVAFNGHLDVAEELRLAYNSIIFEEGFGGRSAIDYAARGGQKEMVAYLVRHEADVSAEDGSGLTPLFSACIGLYLGPDHDGYPKLKTIKDYEEVIRFLIAQGADILHRSADDRTVLHYVAASDYDYGDEFLRLLVSLGADHNLKARGLTVLHEAISARNGRVVEALLEAGADFEIKSDTGRTALHFAAAEAYSKGCEMLLKAGANPLSMDMDGHNPFVCAIMEGNSFSARVLLDHGKDNEMLQKDGAGVPLFLKAVINQDFKVLKALLRAGADADLRYEGRTGLEEALNSDNPAFVSLFTDNGSAWDEARRGRHKAGGNAAL